jgi:adenylate cyclase
MISPVLLITESSELCQQITEILDQYPVVCCSGAEAAEYCRIQPFRVALVSQNLSSGSGIALFESLKTIRPGLVGLLIACEPDKAVPCLAAMESGFTGLFRRPLDPGQLLKRVERVLESTELREENARLRALLPLYGLGEKFLSSTTEEEVLESLLDVVADQTAADSLSVMLYDEQEDCLRIAASRGIEEELARTIRIQPGDKIAGWVFAERKPVILNRETQKDSPFADLLKRPEIVSAVSFPMLVRDRILGVLNVSHTDGDTRFAESSIEMLGILCTQASLALDNVRSIASMEQKTRVQTLLEQYVAPEVAELMLASDADLAAGLGEIKRVTVLFADIRNFTGMVQQLPLPMLRDFLNDFFQVFTEAIFEHRGTVDKFMGDAVLAIFGAPIELEQANVSAVKTALAICKRFGELKERWRTRDPFFATIDLGIALSCGDMFLGNVGSARRLDYTVIGTNVNIAQRLAAKSSSCRIFITETVRRDLAENDTAWTDMGEMELRGVNFPVRAYCTGGKFNC